MSLLSTSSVATAASPAAGGQDGGTSSSPAPQSSSQQQPPVTFKAFLDKMRHPAAADLVRSIKNFIQAMLDRHAAAVADGNPGMRRESADMQSVAVQRFLEETEDAFRQHPLWRDAREDELEAAGEGLEKYLMTKLHDATFAFAPEDREQDEHLSALLSALQFVLPEHLDIPERVRKEGTYAMAMKELNKINSYKAPRDKLVCIMNCCYIINNLLGLAARGADGVSGSGDGFGADDFLPVLIYVVIHSRVEKLESNLQYIQRFRKVSRLASEAAYFYTNVMSATSFISTVNADSLTIEKKVFIENMRAAGIPFPDTDEAAPATTTTPNGGASDAADAKTEQTVPPRLGESIESRGVDTSSAAGSAAAVELSDMSASARNGEVGVGVHMPPLLEVLDKIEKLGVAAVTGMRGGELRNSYSYIDSSSGSLKVSDVSGLLVEYKELALRHECMVRGLKAWYSDFCSSSALLSTSSAGSVTAVDAGQQQVSGAPAANSLPLIEMKEIGASSLPPPPSTSLL